MIEIKNLVKRYGNNCAVNDISFSINDGEIVGFLGPNGAGKSTTMNILTGYLSSTSGRISVAGIDVLVDPLAAKRQIGYLPEQPPLYLDMTVDEYLNFNYDLKGCKLSRKAHLAEVCEVVRIEDVRGRVIRNLSKGYRQRVGIAGALIGNPRVIIFDEPTVGLDPKQIIEIRNLIRTLGKDHTVILSTHILQEVQAVCDRIVIINKGKVVADELTENINRVADGDRRYRVKICGPQREVMNMLNSRPDLTFVEALPERDGEAYTYMVESAPNVDMRKSLFFTLAQKGWPLVGMEALGMSLEDVFISIVDKTDGNETLAKKGKNARRGRTATDAEQDLAQAILDSTAEQQKTIAPYVEGDD